MLAGIGVTYLVVSVWEFFHAPKFNLEVSDHWVEYSFRGHDLAEAFAKENEGPIESESPVLK
jgi:hypothetical protein